MIEEWKDIPGYVGLYQVSNKGRVRRILKNNKYRMKKFTPSDKDYLCVTLSKDGKSKFVKVHRLVMLAFVGKSTLMVNHINGKKKDNRLINLEYVSNRENINHSKVRTRYLAGVERYDDRGLYAARARRNNVRITIGRFKTEIEAHNAYKEYIKSIGEAKYV